MVAPKGVWDQTNNISGIKLKLCKRHPKKNNTVILIGVKRPKNSLIKLTKIIPGSTRSNAADVLAVCEGGASPPKRVSKTNINQEIKQSSH